MTAATLAAPRPGLIVALIIAILLLVIVSRKVGSWPIVVVAVCAAAILAGRTGAIPQMACLHTRQPCTTAQLDWIMGVFPAALIIAFVYRLIRH